MQRSLNISLLLCFLLFSATACSDDAEILEFRASCADVASIRLISPYTSIKGTDYEPGSIYYVSVALIPEAKREYFKFSWSAQGAPFILYINEVIYQQPVDQRDMFKQYGDEMKAQYGDLLDMAFDRSIAARDIPGFDRAYYFNNLKYFKSYEEALAFADAFCPNKVKRGRENVLYSPPESIDWPPPAE